MESIPSHSSWSTNTDLYHHTTTMSLLYQPSRLSSIPISYQNHAYSLITTNFHAFHKSHTLIRVEPYHKQFTATKQGKIVRPAAGLAQARGLRSGEGSALAQAAGSRLGETASRGLGVSRRLA